MGDNGEKERQKKILEGIQYLAGDNKHLREELREFARQAAEDRKRADEDRKRAEEDRGRSDERFERIMEKAEDDRARSDERFAVLLDQVKRTNRVAVEIARDIRRQLRDGQRETHRLLGEILKRLPGSNGK